MNDPFVLGAIAGAVAVLAGLLTIRVMRGGEGKDLSAPPPMPSAPPRPVTSPEGKPIYNEKAVAGIADALNQGNKIEAIKLLREATGLGLAEAKTAVEDMERKLRS